MPSADDNDEIKDELDSDDDNDLIPDDEEVWQRLAKMTIQCLVKSFSGLSHIARREDCTARYCTWCS